jgi:hypothetical protein
LMEVVRLNIKTGEALSVHKSLNSGRLWFIGMKDNQYLYSEHLEAGEILNVQSSADQEPQPLVARPSM